RDNIDPAFLRRVHITLPFPTPRYEERVKLWRWALGASAGAIDFGMLARPEMTGAAIVSAARLAAVDAAATGCEAVSHGDVLTALGGRWRGEGRIVNPEELGEYRKQAAG